MAHRKAISATTIDTNVLTKNGDQAQYIQRIVDAAPPLTVTQRASISALLNVGNPQQAKED